MIVLFVPGRISAGVGPLRCTCAVDIEIWLVFVAGAI